MAGLYIPNLQMPSTCGECRLRDHMGHCLVLDGYPYVGEHMEFKKYEICPLIPSPTYKRIDGFVLNEDLQKLMYLIDSYVIVERCEKVLTKGFVMTAPINYLNEKHLKKGHIINVWDGGKHVGYFRIVDRRYPSRNHYYNEYYCEPVDCEELPGGQENG